MNYKIKILDKTRLIGLPLSMSLSQNKTPELWRSFMQTCAANAYSPLKPLVSLQVYQSPGDFQSYEAVFTKWAGFFAASEINVPAFLKSLDIEGGQYAVFDYNGGPANAMHFFSEVFTSVLPRAGYRPDFRPHFEKLHENYRENLQEEIWIPIQIA